MNVFDLNLIWYEFLYVLHFIFAAKYTHNNMLLKLTKKNEFNKKKLVESLAILKSIPDTLNSLYYIIELLDMDQKLKFVLFDLIK